MKNAAVHIHKNHPFVGHLAQDFDVHRSVLPEKIIRQKRAAFSKFVGDAFPSKRPENWRFSDPYKMLPSIPTPHRYETNSVNQVAKAKQTNTIKLINGHLTTASLPAGVTINSLSRAISDGIVKVTLPMPLSSEPFASLNSAFADAGIVIRVRAGTKLTKPLHVIHSTTKKTVGLMQYRVYIVLEKDAEAVLYNHITATTKPHLFRNLVTAIELKDRARLTMLQHTDTDAYDRIIHVIPATLNAKTYFDITQLITGGRFVRSEIAADLGAADATITVNSLDISDDKEQHDTVSRVRHLAPHTKSRQTIRAFAAGASANVFTGNVLVTQKAPGSKADQQSEVWLSSQNSIAHAMPQLDILNDDVSCTHGATTKHLDQETLTYVQSRGLSQTMAKHMLIKAFGQAFLDGIVNPNLKRLTEKPVYDTMQSVIQKS